MATGERDPEEQLDLLFGALADRTRRDIWRRTLAGEHSVSALAEHYPMSFAAVQKHVAVLQKAGLITKRRSGREQLTAGEIEAVRPVTELLGELETMWRSRIAAIDHLLAEQLDTPAPSTHTGPDRGPTTEEDS